MTIIVNEPIELQNIIDEPYDGLIVVFDLDGTLVCANKDGSSICLRNYAKQILAELSSYDIKIIVWSAGLECHVSKCLTLLDPKSNHIQGAICRGNWSNDDPILKDISLLTNDQSKLGQILLIDNTPCVVRKYPDNGLILSDFNPQCSSLISNLNLLKNLGYFTKTIHDGLRFGEILHVVDVIHAHPCTTLRTYTDKNIGSYYWYIFSPSLFIYTQNSDNVL